MLRFTGPLAFSLALLTWHVGAEPVAEAISAVRYEDFGAKGDGVADDFAALARAHAHANRNNLPVEARDGATYRIGGADLTIPIETDTDFGTAKFVIDDTRVENIEADVFHVRSRLKPIKIEDIPSLQRNQTRIDAKLPGPCLMIATNRNVKHFIRRGNNANDGSPQTDVFLVDAAGKVDDLTPIIWDFTEISSLRAQPVDPTRLTIRGGHFTTIANQAVSSYDYYARGIAINRSNVLIDGIQHFITGEGESGNPYNGFLNVSKCAHVEIRHAVLTAHKTYSAIGRAGKPTSMGSYDINLSYSVHVSLIGCRQSNDIDASGTWGIMGSNYCKNLLYERCTLSRFDAHRGVTHATIRDSTIGRAGVRLTGGGTFRIENSTVRSEHFIDLRPDYGSTWNGEFIIRNCRFAPPEPHLRHATVIGGSNDGRHDFGYPCQQPWRINVDGLHIEDAGLPAGSEALALFANVNPHFIAEDYRQAHPYALTREVRLRNVTCDSGKSLRISDNAFLFRNVRITAGAE